MRRLVAVVTLVAAVVLLAWQSTNPVSGDEPHVLVIDIDGAIEPITVDHIARGIDKARDDGASLAVIRLDTPGGLVDSTREIVERLLEAPVPVAVYVSPAGARAGSAGTFLTVAANFAVMAPGTNIGAASVVGPGGTDLPDTLARKIDEDTRAFIRSIADIRGRSAEALEDTVSQARAYSEQEALDLNVIDLIAPDMETMLEQLDGRTAETASGPVVVQSAGVPVYELGRTLLEHLLAILANPTVAFALFLVGGIALLVELSAPGIFAPGVVAAISLTLFFVGFFNLPGNWIGLLLLAVAVGLFYAETTAPGFSAFGLGGIVALVLGAVFLFGNFFSPSELQEPSFSVHPIAIGIAAGLATVTWILFIRLVMHGGGVARGFQAEKDWLIEGAWGVALSDLEPAGRVRVSDKEWSATADPGVTIPQGDMVRVVAVYGKVLKVERLQRKRNH